LSLHRALTAAYAAAFLCALAAPARVLAATSTTAKDPYGENDVLNLPATGTSAKAEAVSSGGGSLVRTFIGLAVVVAIIYGLTWVLRQMKAAQEERSSGFALSTQASVPLGPGRSVHLIRAGRELVLVGSAEQGVVPIRTYSEAEARELGLLDEDPGTGTAAAPAVSLLRSAIDRLRDRTAR
jgi:flagellar protein FliO/FliZ